MVHVFFIFAWQLSFSVIELTVAMAVIRRPLDRYACVLQSKNLVPTAFVVWVRIIVCFLITSQNGCLRSMWI